MQPTQSVARPQDYKQDSALSKQESTPRTQNVAILEVLSIYPSAEVNTEPSIYGNKPPANDDELTTCLQELLVAFPQQPHTFWGLVAREAKRRGVSKERIEYIVEHLITSHHYPTITMADFFDVDQYIHELSTNEFYSLSIPHKPLAQIFFAGRYRIVYREDAERYGYPFKPFLSNAELEEQERLRDEERHRKEYEQMLNEEPAFNTGNLK